jgi:glutathione S-transferase
MIPLHHCVSARSLRPLWMLEDLGLPYELKMPPFAPRVLERTYLEVNALGTVPALFDGDRRFTESAAICEYLAPRFTPAMAAYWQRLQQREAYVRVTHKQDQAARQQGVSPRPATEVVD